jgi:hypothetical protein
MSRTSAEVHGGRDAAEYDEGDRFYLARNLTDAELDEAAEQFADWMDAIVPPAPEEGI